MDVMTSLCTTNKLLLRFKTRDAASMRQNTPSSRAQLKRKMPLLNNKKVPLIAPIPYDPKRKRKEIWYLRFTNEMFTSYEAYISRLTLYHQPIWECEVTGRHNLTYEQALESEKGEKDRAEFLFCEALRRSILTRIQFKTSRLDTLVDDILDHFQNHYVPGEIIQCTLGNFKYSAKIIEKACNNNSNNNDNNSNSIDRPWKKLKMETTDDGNGDGDDDMSDSSESESDTIPRQPNGRLRFPEAFLHPEPSTPKLTKAKPSQNNENQYKIQLIDKDNKDDDGIRTVDIKDLKRDLDVFNRSNIQRFIRECVHKRDGYSDTPWFINPSVASAYNIDTTLPKELQEIVPPSTVSQKKKAAPAKTADEKEAEKKAKREQYLLQKMKLREERERQREEKKRQAAVKYPLEDLDLPIYRKDPNTNWTLVDMCPQTYTAPLIIPYPSGGRSERPTPHQLDSSIPLELFDTFLSVWTFLTVFSEPLKIPSFSIDEFERALLHRTHQPKATVLVEYNACLLNVIINERKKNIANELISGDVMEAYVEEIEDEDEDDMDEDDGNDNDDDGNNKEGDDDDDDDDEQGNEENKPKKEKKIPRIERGWRDEEHLKISKKWDNKELRASYDRRGWETTLIGCLNDVATPDFISDLDSILQHLVPRYHSSAADREQQYPTLSLKSKLDILNFLVDVVNESTLIKDYMEYCHEQISELRRQKIELNKEFKALHMRKVEMDRRDRAEKIKQAAEDNNNNNDDDDDNDNDGDERSDDESDENNDSSDDSKDEEEDSDSDNFSDSSMNLLDRYERRHHSRQEKLRQKQKEREEMERSRSKMYHEQREAAKAKNQELRIKAEERRKLEDEEKTLRKKEEQIEKGMRRYMTLRVRPLGKDRFYNKYIYLDNVGVTNTCGSGRLYVHSPSDIDIQMMMERDLSRDFPEQPWGYGGGRWFILTLMKEQGLVEESEWVSKRMDELKSGTPSEDKGWWKCYSNPEEIQQLLSWLNPKGIREYKLKNELLKQQSNLAESMKKRAHALTKKEPINKRITRSKAVASATDSWSQHK